MSSVDSIVSQYAASDPAVATAVTKEQTVRALFAGIASGDPGVGSLLASVYNQANEINTLLNSASGVTSGTSPQLGIGGNLDIKA